MGFSMFNWLCLLLVVNCVFAEGETEREKRAPCLHQTAPFAIPIDGQVFYPLDDDFATYYNEELAIPKDIVVPVELPSSKPCPPSEIIVQPVAAAPIAVPAPPELPTVHQPKPCTHEHKDYVARIPASPVAISAPSSGYFGSYSFKQVHSDGSETNYGNRDNTASLNLANSPAPVIVSSTPMPIIASPILNRIMRPQPVPMETFIRPQAAEQLSYSYKQIGADGSVADYNTDSNVHRVDVNRVNIPQTFVPVSSPAPSFELRGKPLFPIPELPKLPTVPQYVETVSATPAPLVETRPESQKMMNSGSYYYKQIFNDGSVAAYDAGQQLKIRNDGFSPKFAPLPVSIMASSSDSIFEIPSYAPGYTQGIGQSGFRYKQIHNDGSVTDFAENQNVGVKGYAQTVSADFPSFSSMAPIVAPVSQSSYSYKQIGADGSASDYSPENEKNQMNENKVEVFPTLASISTVVPFELGGGKPLFPIPQLPKLPEMPHFVEPVSFTPAPLLENPEIVNGAYSYKQINTGKSNSDCDNKQKTRCEGFSSTLTPISMPIVSSTAAPLIEMPFIEMKPAFAQNSDNAGYSYKQIFNDGSVSEYSVGQNNGFKSTIAPAFIDISTAGKMVPNVYTSGDAYSYQQINTDGSVINHDDREQGAFKSPFAPISFVSSTAAPLIEVPAIEELAPIRIPSAQSGGYSYKQVYSDGPITGYTGSEDTGFRSTIAPAIIKVSPEVEMTPKFQKAAMDGAYSYQQINNDGSVTFHGAGEHSSDFKSAIVPLPSNIKFDSSPDAPLVGPKVEIVNAPLPEYIQIPISSVKPEVQVTVFDDKSRFVPNPERRFGNGPFAGKLRKRVHKIRKPVSEISQPIVVGDGSYSYKQSNADGSSMKIESDNRDKVEVSVEEAPAQTEKSRGDI